VQIDGEIELTGLLKVIHGFQKKLAKSGVGVLFRGITLPFLTEMRSHTSQKIGVPVHRK